MILKNSPPLGIQHVRMLGPELALDLCLCLGFDPIERNYTHFEIMCV